MYLNNGNESRTQSTKAVVHDHKESKILAEAKARIEARVTDQMIGTTAVVSIGDLRSIRVFVLGEAERLLDALTGKGSSLLVMAIVGGAVVPLAMGWVADNHGLQLSFLLPMLCYLYIVFYAWRGSRHAA